jgi:hypothetical protein
MTADPRGRWFQLSLRTMFACVTVAAIGLAELVYGLKWIGERHAYTDNLGSHGYIVVGSDEGSAPGLLWLFGERGFDQLRISFIGDPDEDHLTPNQRHSLQRIRELYPEADIIKVIPPFTGVAF